MDEVLLFAYLDAGTGSIILQSIVGIAAGIAVFGRRMLFGFWDRVRSFFSRSRPSQSTDKS